MRVAPISRPYEAVITQQFPEVIVPDADETAADGNMLPRLCAIGDSACAQTCQLAALKGEMATDDKSCAEKNITDALEARHIAPANFARVYATKDSVGFADSVATLAPGRHPDGYATIPAHNAFFFRPGEDAVPGNADHRLTHIAMAMADCGAVAYEFKDRAGKDVIGLAHFSRTNMRGPSEYIHELDGKKVSWAEYVLASAVRHYDADPASVKVKVVAAVESKDFIHHYADPEAMRKHYPGWEELGFMHPVDGKEQDFDCLIDYREMIEWQLKEGVQDSSLKLNPDHIDVSSIINTGDLTLGHASHHWSSKGNIPAGRDLYILGLDPVATLGARIQELERHRNALQANYDWLLDLPLESFMNAKEAEVNHGHRVELRGRIRALNDQIAAFMTTREQLQAPTTVAAVESAHAVTSPTSGVRKVRSPWQLARRVLGRQ